MLMNQPGHLYLRRDGEVTLYLGKGNLVNADLSVTTHGHVRVGWLRHMNMHVFKPADWFIQTCRRWTSVDRDILVTNGVLAGSADDWRVHVTGRACSAVLDLGPVTGWAPAPVITVDSAHAWHATALVPGLLLSGRFEEEYDEEFTGPLLFMLDKS